MRRRSFGVLGSIVVGIAALVALAMPAMADGPEATVYVARRGWHIDVGYATRDLREPLFTITKHFPKANYVFFGFGDLHYLADKKNQHGLAMAEALWPGPGIVLVTTIDSSPAQAFGGSQVVAVPLSHDQLKSSQAYIWKSLASGPDGVDVFKEGPYEGSYYFLATAKYSAFHTCNTWAAQTLRAAGLPVHAQGVLFAHQLWSQMIRIQRLTDPSSRRAITRAVNLAQLQGGLVPS